VVSKLAVCPWLWKSALNTSWVMRSGEEVQSPVRGKMDDGEKRGPGETRCTIKKPTKRKCRDVSLRDLVAFHVAPGVVCTIALVPGSSKGGRSS
jgi:hypothetical protein